jgi:hypothetical protein
MFDGIYSYLDSTDRLVVVDGETQALLRVKAERRVNLPGRLLFLERLLPWLWKLRIDEQVGLMSAVTAHCGGTPNCDFVFCISAGARDVVWFVTSGGLVGTYDPANGEIHSTLLANGAERVENSISTTADGRAAIITDRALYLFEQGAVDQGPILLWRAPYDHGSARKPGTLTRGSGTTPSFSGSDTGNDYVTYADNADETISLVARYVSDGSLLCQLPLFEATENSFIAVGSMVVATSTYGVNLRLPELFLGLEPSVPEAAFFAGGMVMVDVETCRVIWDNDVRSVTVPKLSTADGYIYTFALGESGPLRTRFLSFVVIDAGTGTTLRRTPVGWSLFLGKTFLMPGTPGPNGVYWQGDVDGIIRVEPTSIS